MKIQSALSLSLFLLAPLAFPLGQPVAQAQNAPAQNAPAQNAQTLTLTGTIVGRRDANEIWLRSYDRYYRVAGKAPFAIQNGDRIRVSGAWKEGVLTGISWKSVEPTGTVKANFSINGAVYRDLPGDEFQVKSLGGAIYRVLALKSPEGLSRGDLVAIIGKKTSGVIVATDVIITSQREAIGTAPAYQPHRAVTGTVTGNPVGNIFELQTDGRRDRVLALYGEPTGVKKGARVRIWAFWDYDQGLWQASNLRVLSGGTKVSGTNSG